MHVTKTFVIPGVTHSTISEVEVKHPASIQDALNLEGYGFHIATTVQPESAKHQTPAHITISVFVDGEQHVVFCGTVTESKKFFSTFPKN